MLNKFCVVDRTHGQTHCIVTAMEYTARLVHWRFVSVLQYALAYWHSDAMTHHPRESEGICFYRRWFVCV